MIKKLLLALLFACSTSWAQTVVPVVWPFNPGSTQSNYIRTIIEDANSRQQKYKFIFEHKPGAGGAIAANYVLNSHGPMILSANTSFFTRPLFFPNESYSASGFLPVITQMSGAPIAIVSKKYSSLTELKNQSKLSIGIINGSITQLAAEALAKQLPGVDLVFVPFSGTPEITMNVIGGHLDLGVDFASDLVNWVNDKKVSVIGLSGKKSYPNFPTFASQGVNDFDGIVQNYFFVVGPTVSDSMRKELHDILRPANTNVKTVDLYRQDFAIPADQTLAQSEEFWQSLFVHWQKVTKKTLK